MSTDKLKRVLWRLRSLRPNCNKFSHEELKRAIMFECGTDPATIRHNREAMKLLGWIKSNSRTITLSNKDLEQ